MKALANIVDGDSSVLSNEKVLEAVKARFRDKSALVREAAIDLIGKYAMNSDALLAQYYPFFRDVLFLFCILNTVPWKLSGLTMPAYRYESVSSKSSGKYA